MVRDELRLISTSGSEVKRIAGGKSGYRDGSANEAQFQRPRGLAVDNDGSIYVADTKNTAVRMITRAGKPSLTCNEFTNFGGKFFIT